mmetsp:Transcript_25397/g.74753  ORF Transcript_25397/g.74753 Transcript_25397/m.74753 type:complete len:230 (-) Transcript_25397:655-1344(-)
MSRSGPSGAAAALLGVGTTDGSDPQGIHTDLGIVHLELAISAIDDVAYAVDRQGRLGDVGGDDAFSYALGRRVEYLGLQVGGKLGVHGQYQQRGRILAVGQFFHLLGQYLTRTLDVLLSRHEDEYVPGGAVEVYLERLLHGRHHVILLYRLGKVRVDRKRPPGNAKHRHSAEKVREGFGAQRGRGDDQFEIGPTLHDLAQYAEQYVGVETAFVRLVHDDGGIFIEIGVS